MLNIIWNNYSERPVLRCNQCNTWVKSHTDALVGWQDCDQSERDCAIVHQGCKLSFEADQRQKMTWMTVEDFFWQLADEINVMRKAVNAVRSKRRNKRRHSYRKRR